MCPGNAVSLDALDGTPRGAVLCVVGARPNFMKIAPIMAAFAERPNPLPAVLVHTGQHYDSEMSESFFDQLGIPKPSVDLEVGSASHAVQTAEIMLRFEPVLDRLRPRAVLVVGDVNSTIACSLVAVKKEVPVVHVEAGLRSFDRGMPEEVNRVLTDQLSELLFTTEASAAENLRREGIEPARVHFVGNVMIDTLLGHRRLAVPAARTIERIGRPAGPFSDRTGFGVVTLHRPSNVDDPVSLERMLDTFTEIGRRLPLFFPLHPRTRNALEKSGLLSRLTTGAGIVSCPPLGYLAMLGMMSEARLVLTDSGGIQEETTALGVPCLTLRQNTERPITVEQGTNTVVGTDPERILEAVSDVLKDGGKAGCVPELWDGRASHRIREVMERWLNGN